MFRETLFLQWKTVRWPLALLAVAAFGLPVLATEPLVLTRDRYPSGFQPGLTGLQTELAIWLPLFPLLAIVAGSTLALAAWYWDHRERHVYALSLPLERWRYAALKMAAGAVLLGVVVLAFGVGALLAGFRLQLPDGLHAYPGLLTVRFALASLLAYSLVFALAAGTIPTAMRALSTFAVILVALLLAGPVLGELVPSMTVIRLGAWVSAALTSWAGPFGVFGGSWMLVDV